eukprot:scaffold131411_cov32-Tisochrysis_lutea.AAC.1
MPASSSCIPSSRTHLRGDIHCLRNSRAHGQQMELTGRRCHRPVDSLACTRRLNRAGAAL